MAPPLDPIFFCFFSLSFFPSLFWKNYQHRVVGNIPGNVWHISPPPPKTHSFGHLRPFSEAKVKFLGSKIMVKKIYIYVLTLTNCLTMPISKSSKISIYLFGKKMNLCPYMGCSKILNYVMVNLFCLLSFGHFLGHFYIP